jgi:hypothetical protein
MIFSNIIFEATVSEVSYDTATCTLNPLSANPDSEKISNVPLDYKAGSGNSGIFASLKRGTRVIAMHTSGAGIESTVIACRLPKREQLPGNFRSSSGNVPVGTVAYPEMVDGRLVIQGATGSKISLLEDGDISINSIGGSGIYFRSQNTKHSYTLISEDASSFTNAGRTISGAVRRITGAERNLLLGPDRNQEPMFADSFYAKNADDIGFFRGSLPLKVSIGNRKRNPVLAEYRQVINEFVTDSMFTGFDNEVDRIKNNIRLNQDSETYKRNREPGNTLHLAEHELIEIIGGNVVDINGRVLDLNYNVLSYGEANDRVPKTQVDVSYDQAKRISRRGIGWHFQLSTNTISSDLSTSDTNFIFDIDKEGMLKVNIPASSDTGNIPFPSKANFLGLNDQVEIEYSNPTELEPIPVTLRDANGEVVYPDRNSQGGNTHRGTGIRFENSIGNPYFSSGSDGFIESVRVNTTKYHNMYAAAERLIANRIVRVNPPDIGNKKNGRYLPSDLSNTLPFEIHSPDQLILGENINDPSTSETLSAFPKFMSTVVVDPGSPAIFPGGDTVVAGVLYPDNDDNLPQSNLFTSSRSGDNIEAQLEDEISRVGGKSAHLDLGGSIEASIGADNADRKSIMLDTEGSLISWLGKDLNNRSMVLQTDGDMLINVGGSYSGEDPDNRTMNVGRLEIRVNLTDKGFVATQFADGDNPGADSDFIISISEEGFVIGGMKSGVPMIIRNEGPLVLESSSGDVTLKGTQVKTIEAKGKSTTQKVSGR